MDQGPTLPAFVEETKDGRSSPANWSARNKDMVLDEVSSKWIHRDKLVRIENEELQAAGFTVPKTRPSSKLKRDRSESRLGQQDNDRVQTRPRQDDATLDTVELTASPSWDLRTPEEIADAERNAYFMSTGAGGTKIPLAKSSPVPLSLDFLEKGSQAIRRYESMDEDTLLAYGKTRSRSASASLRDTDYSGSTWGGKRSVTDTSPKKSTTGARQGSVASKASATSNRPSTRSGPNKESPGTRPGTRSGRKASRAKHPEGDPPWLANSYKPDPRLPPDQQLPAEVAKRLAQEQMERDGVFGDAYDKDFRPLNSNSLLKPSTSGNLDNQQWDEWPLKPAVTTSPLQRQGSTYSTMPKISDKLPTSPVPSPRVRQNGQMQAMPQPQTGEMESFQQDQSFPAENKKGGGCGCCVVM